MLDVASTLCRCSAHVCSCHARVLVVCGSGCVAVWHRIQRRSVSRGSWTSLSVSWMAKVSWLSRPLKTVSGMYQGVLVLFDSAQMTDYV
jgi:hypothetical protein